MQRIHFLLRIQSPEADIISNSEIMFWTAAKYTNTSNNTHIFIQEKLFFYNFNLNIYVAFTYHSLKGYNNSRHLPNHRLILQTVLLMQQTLCRVGAIIAEPNSIITAVPH